MKNQHPNEGLATPAGLRQHNNFNHLAKNETNEYPNEFNSQEFAFVSLTSHAELAYQLTFNDQIEIAAPTGIGSGDKIGKLAGCSEDDLSIPGHSEATLFPGAVPFHDPFPRLVWWL